MRQTDKKIRYFFKSTIYHKKDNVYSKCVAAIQNIPVACFHDVSCPICSLNYPYSNLAASPFFDMVPYDSFHDSFQGCPNGVPPGPATQKLPRSLSPRQSLWPVMDDDIKMSTRGLSNCGQAGLSSYTVRIC